MGLSPNIFGPKVWLILHTMAAHYSYTPSAAERLEMYNLLINMAALLPCAACARHLREKLALIGSDAIYDSTADNASLFLFIYNLHNIVNKATNKPHYPFAAAIYEYYPATK